MKFKSISYYLGLFCFPISILSFINILYSSYFDYFLNIDSYIVTLFASLFTGIGLVIVGWSEVDRVSFFAEVFNRRNFRYQHQWESFKPGRKIDDVESKEKNQEVFKENKAFLISEIFAKYHLLDLRAGSQKTFRYIYIQGVH